MSRVALSKINSLTLYKGELTEARRLPPVPQLKCVGKACKLFQPEVVRCHNNGGTGTEIDWTCEADLPESLRFGRVDVSCEGWARAGDPYVLKGSCGLEYRLVDMSDKEPRTFKLNNLSLDDILRWSFILISVAIAIYILFKPYFLRLFNWLRSSARQGSTRRSSSSRPSEWYSGGPRHPPSNPPRPPPPYSEHPDPPKPESDSRWSGNNNTSTSTGAGPSSGSGFWSGVGLGGLGGLAAARMFGGGGAQRPYPTQQEYDWERERRGTGRGFSGLFGSPWSSPGPSRPRASGSYNRGEGSSSLGSMRRSTGYGVTNVR